MPGEPPQPRARTVSQGHQPQGSPGSKCQAGPATAQVPQGLCGQGGRRGGGQQRPDHLEEMGALARAGIGSPDSVSGRGGLPGVGLVGQ